MSTYRDNLARPLQKPDAPQYAPKKQAQRSPESKALAKEKLRWLGAIVFCIVVSLVLVSRYAHMVSLNYSVEKQKDSLQQMHDKGLQAEKQVLELEAPERIKSVAANKLGMKQVDDQGIVILPGSQK